MTQQEATLYKQLVINNYLSNEEMISILDGDEAMFRDIKQSFTMLGIVKDVNHLGLSIINEKKEQNKISKSPQVVNNEYDIFISYAHSDNEAKQVDKLVSLVEKKHQEYNRDHLGIFFDSEGIKTMDDWKGEFLPLSKHPK